MSDFITKVKYNEIVSIFDQFFYIPSLLGTFTLSVRELTSLILMVGALKPLPLNIDVNGFFVVPSEALIPGFPLGAVL